MRSNSLFSVGIQVTVFEGDYDHVLKDFIFYIMSPHIEVLGTPHPTVPPPPSLAEAVVECLPPLDDRVD